MGGWSRKEKSDDRRLGRGRDGWLAGSFDGEGRITLLVLKISEKNSRKKDDGGSGGPLTRKKTW